MTSGRFGHVPVAVVGMACRLPDADDIDEFWQLLITGRSAARALPPERFNRELYFDVRKGVLGKSYTDRACLVRYRPLDRVRYPVPSDVAECPEIAYTTLCEVAFDACRHAGWDVHELAGKNAGVYIGHTRKSGIAGEKIYHTWIQETAGWLRETPSFRDLGLKEQFVDELIESARRGIAAPDRHIPELGSAHAAGIVTRALGLTGPYMAFNSACASSLQAVAQGVRALQRGRIDMAFVGGASYCHVDTLILFSRAQSVTSGISRPFDADADGLVVGEGYVVFALKRLDDALADGDRVWAVLRGIGLSSDGHGKSLWAPRKEGQIEAVRRAYGDRLDPSRLQYLEAHATSTQLGDATEIAAMAAALGNDIRGQSKIPIASVKANIGHTLETAGIAGLLKVILAMNERTIPPAIHVERLNPRIAWDEVLFDVPRQRRPWPDPAPGVPRRAAVNAFGIGGLNVHVVVDEYISSVNYQESDFQASTTQRFRISSESTHKPYHPESDDAVAILGLGAVLPGALSVESLWSLLTSGDSALRPVPKERWDANARWSGSPALERSSSFQGGFITDFQFDWRRHKIPPKQIEHASPLQFMILDAVEQALKHAGFNERHPLPKDRSAAIVGTNFGGEFAGRLVMGLRLPELCRDIKRMLGKRGIAAKRIDNLVQEYTRLFLDRMPALLDETGSFTSSSLASRITKSFDMMGGAVAVDAGFGSALAALECASDQLLAGDCDLMICVAGSEDLGPYRYENLYYRGMLKGANGPDSNGCSPGEGCVAFILKRWSDARRDGDRVLAVLRGIGSSGAAAVDNANRHAVERALWSGRDQQSKVVLLETVGTGNARLDRAEQRDLRRYLSPVSSGQPLPVQEVLPQLGHLAGASGGVLLLKAILELERQELTPSGNRTATRLNNRNKYPMAAVHASAPHECTYHVIVERGSPVTIPDQHNSPVGQSVNGTGKHASSGDGMIYFDATARRRERLRKHAATPPAAHVSAPEAKEPADSIPLAPLPSAPLETARLSQTAGLRPSSGTVEQNGPLPQHPSHALRPSAEALEGFLISFVVEQTGYPTEIVEMDVDLEADLGIDSIKKAQLFGELREHFQIDFTESASDLSLDDFPTLGHVRDFLLQPEVSASGSQAAHVPEQDCIGPALHSDVVPDTTSRRLSRSELETFLVNFVVEQTGYPSEIVELDADLEADLGIDSIKKAQLLGELREHFHMDRESVASDLSLDDFPTLAHIRDFLIESERTPLAAPVSDNSMEARANEMESGPPTTPSPRAAPLMFTPGELETFLVNFVVEQTGYPPEIVDLEADLEADLGIDSIKKAQLLGELREQFQLEIDASSGELSLDDFPTLGHIRDFLRQAVSSN